MVEQAKILVVDDDEDSLVLLAEMLRSKGYQVVEARDGKEALEVYSHELPDLVLLDVMMPKMNGFETCRQMKARMTTFVPIIMVTVKEDLSSRLAGFEHGADDYLTKPFEMSELCARVRNMLRIVLLQDEVQRASEKRRQAEDDRRVAHEELIFRLARAAEFRTNETAQHVQRMSLYCTLLARKLGMDEEHCKGIRLAASMHDIGKLAIPDTILLKPAGLTEPEFQTMMTHAEIGHRLLTGSSSKLVQLAADIAQTHHEKFDGTGYPKGLAAKDIPLEGRIAAVADVFDALTSERCYKSSYSVERAIGVMEDSHGHFDPNLIQLFLRSIDEVLAIRDTYPDHQSK